MRWSYRNVYEVDLLKRNHYYYHEHGNIFTRIKIGLLIAQYTLINIYTTNIVKNKGTVDYKHTLAAKFLDITLIPKIQSIAQEFPGICIQNNHRILPIVK